jgi:hypothetical protein
MKWSLVALAVAACHGGHAHPSDAPADTPVDAPAGGSPISGSRLKARWFAGTDGFKTQTGWFDSQLQVNCTFQDASDGKRCLPQAGGLYYLDAGCTQPATLFTASSCVTTPPPYALHTSSMMCGSVIDQAYAVGARVAATQVYFDTGAGGCTMTTVSAGTDVYRADTAVPLTSFVAATAGLEVGSGRLAHTYLDADDGARAITGIQDTTLGETCVLLGTAPNVGCMPGAEQTAQFFSDATCRDALVFKNASTCAAPSQYATLYDSTTCSYQPKQLGADFTGTSAYVSMTGTCTAMTVSAGQLQTVTDLALPTLSYSATASTTRLTTGVVQLDGFSSAFGAVHDTQLGFDCFVFMHDATGTQRCLPPPYLRTTALFTDATCKTAVRVATVSPSACGTPVPAFVDEPDSTMSCTDFGPPFNMHVYPVTTQITTQLYQKGTTCTPFTGPLVYATGPEQPPTSFEPITVTVDP